MREMITMRTICILLATFLFQNGFPQQNKRDENFHPPLDIPMFLSGNFAEIRSDHFHSGIDIKTQGVTGKRVYSVEKGFVSRIKVQSNGYGNSVYISHPNGLTSLYGHLNSFSQKIDDFLKSYQYRNRSFEADIYLSPGDIPVTKGEIIALSGNTGSSGGPHLHFELRETSTQKPLNVLNYGFDIEDNISPRLYSLFLYGNQGNGQDRRIVSRKEYKLTGNGGDYHISSGLTLTANEYVSFGLEAYDFLNGSGNRCGIYSLELYVDDKPIYRYQTDKFGFDEMRYLNAHIDYAFKMLTGRGVNDLFELPNERLSMNKLALNNAVIFVKPDDTLQISIIVRDVYQNESRLRFTLKGMEKREIDKAANKEDNLFRWYKRNIFSSGDFSLEIPEDALYENTYFTYSRVPRAHSFYPFIHIVQDEHTPLHTYAEISMGIEGISERLHHKLCIVQLNKGDKPKYAGGRVKNGRITTSIRELGRYSIEADTIAPVITLLNFKKGEDVRAKSSLRIRAMDNLSGIGQYKAFIDDTWALMQYDAKSDMLTYEPDNKHLIANRVHSLDIFITDNMGNWNEVKTSFYW